MLKNLTKPKSINENENSDNEVAVNESGDGETNASDDSTHSSSIKWWEINEPQKIYKDE